MAAQGWIPMAAAFGELDTATCQPTLFQAEAKLSQIEPNPANPAKENERN
jgi:hypothetical protein